MRRTKLTKRAIDNLRPATTRFVAWDTEISGFGLRVTPSGERIYVCKTRVEGRQRWLTIGRHGSPWTPEQARKEALRLLGDIARGIDPTAKRREAREAITFGELCDLYLREGVAHKKDKTVRSDRGRIEHHLKPLLGRKRADQISRGDIEKLLTDVKSAKTAVARSKLPKKPGSVPTGGPGVAAQCVALASTILKFAVDRRLRSDNPALGIRKPPVRKLERFLSIAELAKLACSLEREGQQPGALYPIAAIRLLALTGARRGEILGLCWRDVDLERRLLNLRDSKTREKKILLSEPAAWALRGLPRVEGSGHVFPGAVVGKQISSIDRAWNRVRAGAGLQDVRIHDLRHTFAAFGASSGLGLPIVGKLLGHSQAATTERYAHLADDPVRRAADAIGLGIAQAMGFESI